MTATDDGTCQGHDRAVPVTVTVPVTRIGDNGKIGMFTSTRTWMIVLALPVTVSFLVQYQPFSRTRIDSSFVWERRSTDSVYENRKNAPSPVSDLGKMFGGRSKLRNSAAQLQICGFDSMKFREADNTNPHAEFVEGTLLIHRDGCDECTSRRNLIRHLLAFSASLVIYPSNSYALEDDAIDAEAEVRALRIASELMRENAALVRKELSSPSAPPEEIDLGYPGTDVRRRRIVLSRVARLSQVRRAPHQPPHPPASARTPRRALMPFARKCSRTAADGGRGLLLADADAMPSWGYRYGLITD